MEYKDFFRESGEEKLQSLVEKFVMTMDNPEQRRALNHILPMIHSLDSDKRRQYKRELIDLLNKFYKDHGIDAVIKEVYRMRSRLIQENIGMMRKDMPQIKSGELKQAVKALQGKGITVKKGRMMASRMKPSQEDINNEKVKAIMDRTDSVKGMKPLVISEDNYIVDGHHRWAALKRKFPTEPIPYYRIDLPIREAIEIYKQLEAIL